MKIVTSAIKLASEHQYEKKFTTIEGPQFFTFLFKPGKKSAGELKQLIEAIRNELDNSGDLTEIINRYRFKSERVDKIRLTIPRLERLKIRFLEHFLQEITGKAIRFHYQVTQAELKDLLPEQPEQSATHPANPVNTNTRFYQESEKLTFTAAGIVRTADGRTVDLNTTFNVSRSFLSMNQIAIQSGKLIDPLVINFSGPAAELTETKFQFDLDVDGSTEDIPFVTEASGLLALDLNNDNIINNGQELFGALTGNGFNELAEYDSDRNGWIDESDSVFDRLRIWTKDSQGNDSLFALGRKGIGAIYLGNIATEFDLKDQTNQLLGKYERTGLYLQENGRAGTIQQVDFTA